MCREEAVDVAKRFDSILEKNAGLRNVPLIGIIKEVAPTKSVETDEKLGVNEFHVKYFNGRPLYLDEEKLFYRALGGRKLTDSFSFWALLKPWELYSSFVKMGARLKEKKIDGNLAGEGLLQGGLMVFGPGEADAIYVYQEKTGSEIPLDELEASLLDILKRS